MTADKTPAPNRLRPPDPAPLLPQPFVVRFWLTAAVVAACFGRPLYLLVQLSLQNDLYSHVLLIPFISGYLVWIQRAVVPTATAPDRRIAFGLLGAGLLLLGFYWTLRATGEELAPEDGLALLIPSFLLFFAAICGWFIGRSTMRALAFPLGFLVFMAPFPAAVTRALEMFFQHTSAAAAHLLFKLGSTPVFYHDLIFQLPGINLEVAPQCSGIRSSLALFITSIVAGRLFLQTPWKRAVLAAAVVPLAFLRNGFRIFTIGELCVHVSPDMINSPIHHHGGPVFFALSLVPFFLLLRLLYKSDHPSPGPGSVPSGG